MQIVFQDSVGSLDPRMKVGDLIAEGLGIHGLAGRKDRERGRARDARARRHAARGRRPLPAPVQRRPAAADRARARARAAAEARRRRRAGLGARRLDPVAGAEPARRAEEGVRPHLRLRRPRPRRRRLHLRPRRRHVPRPDRRDRAVRRAVRAAAAPVHDGAALGEPGARARPQEHRGSSSPATCRARSTRRPAAASAPAARSRRRSAPRSTRCSRITAPTTAPPATSPGRRSPAPAPTLHDRQRVSAGARRPAAPRPARADARRDLALGRRLPPARRPGPADDRPVDAVRVDARALHRLGRLVRAAAATPPSSSTSAAATSRRATFTAWELDGVDALRHRHLGRRRAVVERAHRHLGPELRRPRPVAARAPAASEPPVRRAAGDPRRLLLGRLLDGRRLPARAHARRRGALDERDGADHRARAPATSSSTTASSATCR